MVSEIAAAASVAAGIWSEAQAQSKQAGSQKEAQRILDEARAEIAKITPPDPEQQKAFYQQIEYQGDVKPTQEAAVQAGPTAMEGISTDPALKQAQMNALAKLQTIGQDGLDSSDRFALSQIQSANSQKERGSREAILQDAQRRGMGGSGSEMLAKLQAQQSSADRNSAQGMQVASMAQQRALEAMMQGGQLAGNIRGQEFGEKSDIARARDAMATFNAGLMSNTNSRNADRVNQAAYRNQDTRQNIAGQNTGIQNAQTDQQIASRQQGFNNQMDRAQAMAGASGASASQRNNMGAQQAQNTRNWGQMATNVMSGGADAWDKYNKKGS